jgi:hypothetical protein
VTTRSGEVWRRGEAHAPTMKRTRLPMAGRRPARHHPDQRRHQPRQQRRRSRRHPGPGHRNSHSGRHRARTGPDTPSASSSSGSAGRPAARAGITGDEVITMIQRTAHLRALGLTGRPGQPGARRASPGADPVAGRKHPPGQPSPSETSPGEQPSCSRPRPDSITRAGGRYTRLKGREDPLSGCSEPEAVSSFWTCFG